MGREERARKGETYGRRKLVHAIHPQPSDALLSSVQPFDSRVSRVVRDLLEWRRMGEGEECQRSAPR